MDDSLAGDRPDKSGKPRDSFRPMPANVAAGFILAALSVAAAGSILWAIAAEIIKAKGKLPILVDVGPSWVIFAFFALVSVGFAWLGLYFLRLSTSLGGTGVAFYSEGFRLLDGETGRDVPWASVVGIRETVEYSSPAHPEISGDPPAPQAGEFLVPPGDRHGREPFLRRQRDREHQAVRPPPPGPRPRASGDRLGVGPGRPRLITARRGRSEGIRLTPSLTSVILGPGPIAPSPSRRPPCDAPPAAASP